MGEGCADPRGKTLRRSPKILANLSKIARSTGRQPPSPGGLLRGQEVLQLFQPVGALARRRDIWSVGLRFLFESYALCPERRELMHGAEPVALGPQVFDLLLYLLKNR